MDKPLATVIMAAGKGTRMKNPDVAKVMHPINGKPMIEYVVDLALKLESRNTVVIVGWQKDSVIRHLASTGKNVTCVEQSPQLGTGHAVMQAELSLRDFDGDLLILSGDAPMLQYSTIKELLDLHRQQRPAATVLTAVLDDASGYGRIVRDAANSVIAIVEHKDATEEERSIREINSGIYVFDKTPLFAGLKHITPDNVQKEYYLTDVFEYFWKNNFRVCALAAKNAKEIQGINTLRQLEEARVLMAESLS
jgi:UDP-N-acetylglucosamine pyrophosphorylase